MQMVKKLLMWLFIVWCALLLFMPKQALYYALEKSLSKQGIEINEQSVEEGVFSFTIHQATIYVNGVKVATVDKIYGFTLLFYSTVELDTLSVNDSFAMGLPADTQKASLKHFVWNPINLSLEAQGSFGALEGIANLNKRKVHVDFTETKKIDALKLVLKKDEKGWYYESTF